MKSYLIRIPSDYKNGDKAFTDMLLKVHNVLSGEVMSFELLTMGSSVAYIISASEQVLQSVFGLLYAMMPEAELQELPPDNRIFTYQNIHFTHPDMYSMTTFRAAGEQYEQYFERYE